jgi:hypothetical protein
MCACISACCKPSYTCVSLRLFPEETCMVLVSKCVRVYMYVCVFVRMPTWVSLFVRYVSVRVFVRMHACVFMYLCVYLCVCMHVVLYVNIHALVSVYFVRVRVSACGYFLEFSFVCLSMCVCILIL